MKLLKSVKQREPKNTQNINTENHNLFRKDGMITYNYRLFINEFDDGKLDEIFDSLYDGDIYDTLEVRISSPGGYVLDLQRFQNVIENIFQNRTYCVLDNFGYSAGAFMFLLGSERIAHKSSMIMFHDWSGGYYGKASDIDKQHKFQREHYKNWMRDLLSKYFTEKEIEDMFEGKEYWYNTLEMCKKGIATHVMINGEKISAKEYIAIERDNEKLKKSIKQERQDKQEKSDNTKSNKKKKQQKVDILERYINKISNTDSVTEIDTKDDIDIDSLVENKNK